MKIYIVIILIFLTVCIGCTYRRPLLSIRIATRVSEDSITNGTRKLSNYHYWGVKKITHLGGYSKMIQFDSLGNKTSVSHWKKKPLYKHDGNGKSYTKIYYYTSSGKIEKITKSVVQKQFLSKEIVDETIYFKNGKKIKSTKIDQ